MTEDTTDVLISFPSKIPAPIQFSVALSDLSHYFLSKVTPKQIYKVLAFHLSLWESNEQ